ncbi:hypothetical protein AB674_03060 [Flavobacterium sp. ABG]|nr:hypothetical protein AB674_03060 [Flavobacterium sp. ABG]
MLWFYLVAVLLEGLILLGFCSFEGLDSRSYSCFSGSLFTLDSLAKTQRRQVSSFFDVGACGLRIINPTGFENLSGWGI